MKHLSCIVGKESNAFKERIHEYGVPYYGVSKNVAPYGMQIEVYQKPWLACGMDL